MTVSEMNAVINNIKEFCKKAERLPYLYITGGDPILHPQFWTLARTLKSESIPFAILGNPFHLTPEVCEKLHAYGCRKYQLSLDGLRQTHDQIRRPVSFDESLAVIPYLRNAGIDVAVMTTVSRWNYKEVPTLIDIVVANKVDIWLMNACWEKFEQYKDCATTFNLKDHLWTLFKYEKGLFNPADYPDDDFVYDGCNCGNCHFTILSDGAVFACRRMESKVGNALTDDLYELFTGSKMDAYRTYENFEKCARCELLRFCRGCPAVSAGYHGNMYAADPQCWKEV
jgi:radical SAM protein with 4Fe4S-binding SPASM domain